MIGAFLLYANDYNLKNKKSIIILISVLASMSLAGWMLAFIGFILNLFSKRKIKFSRLLLYVILLLSFIQVGKNYNSGNNVINERILSRLEYDESKGFTGNNRNSMLIAQIASELWSGDIKTILFGYNKRYFMQFEEWELIGSGFDKFLVHHGLLGVLLVLSFYMYTIASARNKKFALLFFIFVLFSFWQRCYALWFSWIICFYYSSVLSDRKKIIYYD